jgi:hypothetical protein
MWTCNSCKQNFPSLTGISAQLKSIEDTTYKRLSKLEDDVHDMKTGLEEKIRGEVKTIKPSLIEEIKPESNFNIWFLYFYKCTYFMY